MMFFLLLTIVLIFYIFISRFRWAGKQAKLIKKLKEEEAKLIHMEKMASIGTLAAGIAHEINNPLSFLSVNLGVLIEGSKNGVKTEETEQIISECLDGVERIKRIVKDLLTFSQRGQGERVEVDLKQLLDSTLRIVWNEIKYKVDLVKDYKAESPIYVDPTQIGQIIVNLVINAYQVIKDKGTIAISTYEDESRVYIKVCDTGPGMTKDVLKNIFEPFFTTKGGTGLGLSVSNDIVKSYGGEIRVKSKVGEGSEFTIVLPKIQDTKAAVFSK